MGLIISTSRLGGCDSRHSGSVPRWRSQTLACSTIHPVGLPHGNTLTPWFCSIGHPEAMAPSLESGMVLLEKLDRTEGIG